MSFTVATYNILHPTYPTVDKSIQPNTWPVRGPQIKQNIIDMNADVLCLQELSKISLQSLNLITSQGYQVHYVKHNDAGKQDGVAICFKKDRFNWLQGEHADYTFNRVTPPHSQTTLTHAYVDLQDKTTNKTIRVATCHLAGGGNGMSPGNKHIDAVLKKIYEVKKNAWPVDSLILTGDFNADQSHERIFTMAAHDFSSDGSRDVTEPCNNRKIDWIWAKDKNDSLNLTPAAFNISHPKASDHLPVMTRFDYTPAISQQNPPQPQNTNPSAATPNPAPIQQPSENPLSTFGVRVLGHFRNKWQGDEEYSVALRSALADGYKSHVDSNRAKKFKDEARREFATRVLKLTFDDAPAINAFDEAWNNASVEVNKLAAQKNGTTQPNNDQPANQQARPGPQSTVIVNPTSVNSSAPQPTNTIPSTNSPLPTNVTQPQPAPRTATSAPVTPTPTTPAISQRTPGQPPPQTAVVPTPAPKKSFWDSIADFFRTIGNFFKRLFGF